VPLSSKISLSMFACKSVLHKTACVFYYRSAVRPFAFAHENKPKYSGRGNNHVGPIAKSRSRLNSPIADQSLCFLSCHFFLLNLKQLYVLYVYKRIRIKLQIIGTISWKQFMFRRLCSANIKVCCVK
jgi:hypothetical protein